MKKDTKKTVPVPEGLPKKPPKAMALFMQANKGLREQSSSRRGPSLAYNQNVMMYIYVKNIYLYISDLYNFDFILTYIYISYYFNSILYYIILSYLILYFILLYYNTVYYFIMLYDIF